jgi:hypothetical protein
MGAAWIHTDATKRLGGTVPAVRTPLTACSVSDIRLVALLLARNPTNAVQTAMIHHFAL